MRLQFPGAVLSLARMPPAPAPSSAFRTWAVGALLAVGTLLLFSRALPFPFTNYDDPAYVTNNAHVKAGLTRDGVVWAFTGAADYWHPLTWLSHMLDWRLFGDDARGHRFVSLLWHAANAVLCFALLRRWTGAFWTAALAAAVFAWHPLRVESVVWVTERKDVMSGAFFLLTLWAYTRFAETRRAGGAAAWRWYAAALALFVAGLASKPMLVSLPLVLLVLDFWPLRRAELAATGAARRAWRGLVLEKLPFFALSAAVSLLTVRMVQRHGAFTLELPLDARLGNAVVSLARYLGKFFVPVDLAVAYPHPGHWPAGNVAAALALAVALSALAWWQRAARPATLAGWLWFLVVLAPALGLVQAGFQAMADRYSYLALLGPVLALLELGRETLATSARRRAVATVAALAVLGGFAARTWAQQAVWRDPVALFGHALRVTDRNDIAEGFLAYTLLGEKRRAEAAPHARRAVELNPRNTTGLFVLAALAEADGRLDDAAAHLERLLAIKPDDAEAAYTLGQWRLRQGRPADAGALFRQALAHEPESVPARLAVADATAREGRSDEAVKLYEALLAARPGEATVHNNFAVFLAVLGRDDAAQAHFREALRLAPDEPAMPVNFGDYFAAARRWPEAIAQYERALALAPDHGPALAGLAIAFERSGRGAEAETLFPRALAAAPQHAAAQRAWADALAKRRRFSEAAEHYAQAVRLQPQDAGHRAAFGYALVLLGRRAEAASQWEEALRLDPEFPDLRRRLDALRR